MKKIIYIMSAVTMLFSINSCSDRFEEIDINPNQTTSPLSYGIFNSANKEYMDEMRGPFSSGRVALPWVQYAAAEDYTEDNRYLYRVTYNATIWSLHYRVAQDYKQIIELNTNPATAGTMSAYGPNENQIAAARTMLAYLFLNLADNFGDVPYYSYGNPDPDFQALQINSYLQPKFASQAKIYADILKELKEASAMIKTDKSVFTSGDALFGSGLKLKKFANSLRLRVATRVKGVVPGAEAAITEAIASGVMTSNADNVGLMYADDLVSPSPMYNAFRTRSDFGIAKTFVDLLKGTKGPFGLDPRLFEYATKTKLSAAELADGTGKPLKARILDGSVIVSKDSADYKGMPYGIASGDVASQVPSANFFSKKVYKKNYTEMFMEYSEVEFLLSEANGFSQSNYEKGVKASMEKWGVPAGSVTSFVNSLPVANKANVLNQKYVALYMQPYEAWAEYRRTGFPSTLLLPGQTGNFNVPTNDGRTNYVFTSLVPGVTDLPTRLNYPTTAQSLNRINYEAASTAIGGDKITSKLIWDKN
jgi:hypothetical protein